MIALEKPQQLFSSFLRGASRLKSPRSINVKDKREDFIAYAHEICQFTILCLVTSRSFHLFACILDFIAAITVFVDPQRQSSQAKRPFGFIGNSLRRPAVYSIA